MKKTASILDYSYPYLDPNVWGQDMKLHAYQKDFILRLISKIYETYQLKQPEVWVTDVVVIGSLTTSKWLSTSDMDVHIRVDLKKFVAANVPNTSELEAFTFLDKVRMAANTSDEFKEKVFEYLDATRKQLDRAKILAPMTQHPIEFYFEAPALRPSNTDLVGVYSLLQDQWLKEPILFEADLDFEESKKSVMEEAERLAQELDGSFGKIERQIKRIEELDEMIRAWGPEKQQLFYKKIEDKLKIIEDE